MNGPAGRAWAAGAWGLWGILRGIWRRSETANLSLVAAGGAFFAMLSLFPALAAIIALIGLITDPIFLEQQLELAEQFIPQDAYEILHVHLMRLVSANTDTLGWTTALTTGAALWSARRGTDALIRGMNAIHGVPQRGGVLANAMALALTLALILVVTIAALTLVAVPMVVRLLTLEVFADVIPAHVIAWATSHMLVTSRWVVAGCVVFGGIWLLYRFAPNGPGARVHLLSYGALLAIGIWLPTSWVFSHYLAFADAYSGVYGSIGAIIALLMFLYLTILSVLVGAALNAELAAKRLYDPAAAGASEPGPAARSMAGELSSDP